MGVQERRAGGEALAKGLRRRGRLLAQALRPPAAAGPRQHVLTPHEPDEGYGTGPGAWAAPPAPRLVESPVFVLSPVRSGSTLLRVLLNSHSRVRAPHEMHLRTVHVRLDRDFTPDAMRALHLDKEELEHLLWDRVLDLELARSGKDVIVDKTPPNTLMWPRLHRAWPRARYLFLLRHPGAVVSSLTNRRDRPDPEAVRAEVLEYAERLEEARQALDGHTLTYEELTEDPERVTRGVCDYLGLEWEPGMLDYGAHDHGDFRPQLGDWSSNIRSGRVQPARRAEPDEGLPPRLREIARAWGYGTAAAGRAS